MVLTLEHIEEYSSGVREVDCAELLSNNIFIYDRKGVQYCILNEWIHDHKLVSCPQISARTAE
jgi:hypothetical protein